MCDCVCAARWSEAGAGKFKMSLRASWRVYLQAVPWMWANGFVMGLFPLPHSRGALSSTRLWSGVCWALWAMTQLCLWGARCADLQSSFSTAGDAPQGLQWPCVCCHLVSVPGCASPAAPWLSCSLCSCSLGTFLCSLCLSPGRKTGLGPSASIKTLFMQWQFWCWQLGLISAGASA